MNMMPVYKRSVVGISLSCALLLAACGGSDSPDGETTSETTSSDVEASGVEESGDEPAADGTSGGTEVVTSSPVDSNYLKSYSLNDDEFGTIVTVSIDGTTRTIEANALPDHETGEFPNAGNPNSISEQDISYSYSMQPIFVGDASEVRTTGVAVNGVKFEPGTAETVTCESGQTFRVEALQDVYNLGLDLNNAHVQPTGEYHYHGVSELLVDAYATDDDLVHVGFAADGFLMFYSKSGAYESGYELSTDARSGTDCVASGPAGGDSVEIEGSAPDGTYSSDWTHSEAAGDLDSCNGIEIDGQYVYIITNEYPYVGRCLNGEVTAEAGGGGGPGGGGGGPAPGGDAPDDESARGPSPEGATPAGDAAPVGNAAPTGNAAPDLAEAAAELGVTEEELMAALGGRPPDLEAAAETLGISVDELAAVLPAPGGPGQG